MRSLTTLIVMTDTHGRYISKKMNIHPNIRIYRYRVYTKTGFDSRQSKNNRISFSPL